MLSALDISTSGLIAQRTRLDTIASNIANISTIRDENGQPQPYQSRHVIFQSTEDIGTSYGAVGVRVSSIELDQAEPVYRWQPNHRLAIKDGERKGYVAYPNINLNQEFVDALNATRSYEANIGAIEVSKDLTSQTLRIIA
jgi:flagellar basal-body rod protein FlgC